MAEFKKEISTFIANLIATFDKGVSKNVMRAVGLEAIGLIKKRTRLGYGVEDTGGPKIRFATMAPWANKKRYSKYRRGLKKVGLLSNLTGPGKQNLTLTGQLIDSIYLKKYKKARAVISIPNTAHKLTGDRLSDIAEEQTDAGRVFMNLSKAELNQLRRFYRQKFGDLVKKQLP